MNALMLLFLISISLYRDCRSAYTMQLNMNVNGELNGNDSRN